VRNYSAPEWHSFCELAGLRVVDERHFLRDTDLADWLARVNCTGETADRVRELLGDRVADGRLGLPTVVLKAAK